MRDLAAMPALLAAFLAEHSGEVGVEVTDYRLMTGGYSRVMARADVRWPDGRSTTVVVRGDPPAGTGLLETDRDHEWAVLQGLSSIGHLPMPKARWYAQDLRHFGTKAIVLDFVDATSLKACFDAGLDPLGEIEALAELFGGVAAVEPSELPEAVERPATWDDYLTSVIDQWRQVEVAYVESSPTLRYIAAWLDANRPPPLPLRLVHGDLQATNVLNTTTGYQLVDWEYAHVGDPREDLGYYNAYTAAEPPNLYTLDPERFLAAYRARTGFDEAAVNQLSVGYFTVLSTIKVLGGIYASVGKMARGEASGLMLSFNLGAAVSGHVAYLGAMAAIDEATRATGATAVVA